MKKLAYITIFLLLSPVIFAPRANANLANQNKSGLYVKSIEQVLRLDPDEIDLGIAALIVAEEWSDVLPGRRYQQRLDDMAYEIRRRIDKQKLQNSPKAVNIINEYLYNELGFKSVTEASDANDLFLNSVMDRKKGYCLSLSFLYLAIGERVGLPLYGVVVPGHFFVRYDNGSVRFNIETTSGGGYQDDEAYRKKFNVPQGANDSIYLKNLNKLQSIGCLFNNLGNVYSQAGNTAAALKALESAVRINPSLAESRTNLGNIYLQQGRVNEAIAQYRQALRIIPDDAKTYNNLGNAYMQQDWFSDAIGAYEKAIRLDNKAVDARSNLAILYSKLGMYDKAVWVLKEAIEIDPSRSQLFSRLASIYFDSGKYPDAVKEYKRALQLNHRDTDAHFGLALCYNKLGKYKDEIRSYKDALSVRPDMASAMINLGNAYFNQKEYDSAIKQYRQAIRFSPDEPIVHYNLGAALSNEGNFKDAVAPYLKTIELNPQMSEAHHGLGIAYYNLKLYQPAKKHLTIAQQLGVEVNENLLKSVNRLAK